MTEAESIAADLRADGQLMILSRTTPGTYDEEAGSVSGAVTQTWSIPGILTSFKAQPGDTTEAGTLIKAGDKLAVLAANQERPVATDTLTDVNGTTWTVVGVDTIEPAGVALLHKCHVRR